MAGSGGRAGQQPHLLAQVRLQLLQEPWLGRHTGCDGGGRGAVGGEAG